MEEKFNKLTQDAAETLAYNALVYITALASGLTRVPALVSNCDASWLRVTYNGECGPISQDFSFFSYGDAWFAEREEGFMVETPVGVLHAWDKKESEYPGICINLYPTGCTGDALPITLAMTEYIPHDGEGLCGWDRGCLSRTEEEINEVPVERMVDNNGEPIAHKMGVTASSGHIITAGLVTRSWPNEADDMDYHKRTFHIVGGGDK